MVLFGAQLYLELQAKAPANERLRAIYRKLSVDEIFVWGWDYADTAPWRMTRELAASSYVAQHDRSRFEGQKEQRDRLTLDMVLYSLLAYLGAEKYDWQLKRTTFRGSMSIWFQSQRVSSADECTALSAEEIQTKFRAAGNAFADSLLAIWGAQLCLPPNATLTITDQSVVIATRLCTVSFALEPSGGIEYRRPGAGGDVSNLANGEPQYETRVAGIQTLVEYSRIRPQHRDMEKYKQWSKRVVDGARLWFEGQPKSETDRARINLQEKHNASFATQVRPGI